MTLGFFGFLVFAIVRYGQIETVSHRGNAVVLDGDTIILKGEKIRLEGIDAPEFSQTCTGKAGPYPCGRDAKRQLAALAKVGPVECTGWQNDKYGRLLGACAAGTVDLNRQMVLSGWAVSYGAYLAEEVSAKKAGKGVWQGAFDRPSDWRKSHDRFAAANDAPHDFWYKLTAFLRRMFGVE
jgi:endonuclease YncB( thermonuclease family)